MTSIFAPVLAGNKQAKATNLEEILAEFRFIKPNNSSFEQIKELLKKKTETSLANREEENWAVWTSLQSNNKLVY